MNFGSMTASAEIYLPVRLNCVGTQLEVASMTVKSMTAKSKAVKSDPPVGSLSGVRLGEWKGRPVRKQALLRD